MKKATRAHTKTHNSRLVLKMIYQQGQVSRAEVARQTRLTRTTVSTLVAEMLEEGLVEETGFEPSKGGKPGTLLGVVDDSRHLIGLDLANSEFRGAVLNLRGQIQHQVNLPVQDRNGQAALSLVFELVDALIAKAGSPLLGIGIGTPGLVDAPRGVVRKAVNLEWQDLPLSDLLAARYQLPVYIANDSHVAALGEYTFGRYHNLTNLVVVKVGRGISAGLVLNGRLYYGDGSGAGEIGHVVLVENGEPCMCGHCGCLETLVSSRAIIRQAREIARQNPQSLLNQLVSRPEAITTGIARQAFDMGDPDLEAVIENVGRYLGIAVAQLIGVVNIETVVIAGSVAQFGPKLLESIRREMQRRAMEMLARPTQVKLSELGQNIVVQGAAALLLANELGIV